LNNKKDAENSIASSNSNGITAAYNPGSVRKDTAMAEMIANYSGKKIVSNSLSRES